MLFILLLILIFLFGFEITVILGLKVDLLERLSLSFLLGIGLSTFMVFLLAYVFNLNFSLISTFAIVTSLCVISFALKFKETTNFFRNIRFRKVIIKPKIAIFWGFVLAIFAYTLLVNSFWPISDWDALALYDFRAKVFLIDKNLIHATLSNGYFTGYPLLTSLAHLFVYQTGINNPKSIYSLFYLSFIVIFYYSLKRCIGENKAIFFTVVLALVPEILSNATIAYTNLAYTVYLCSGTFYLYNWTKNNQNSSLFLSAILVGLSSWVRSAEPFWIVPVAVVSFCIIRNRNWKNFILYLLIFLTINLPWRYFVSYISGMAAPISAGSGMVYLDILKGITLDKIRPIISFLYENVFSTWGLTFFVFILVSVKSMFWIKPNENVFLYITLLFFLLLIAGTFLFSIGYPGWQDIPDSARRMSIFFLPLMLYSIALSINFRYGK